MRSTKLTNYDKRKLTYEAPGTNTSGSSKQIHPLSLPPELQKKISANQYKKIKEAFFIQADQDLSLTRKNFPVVMRSLGIVLNTGDFFNIFDEIQNKTMSWREFLQAYIAKRAIKGSYNELSHAVYDLGKEYRGDWDELLLDLQTIGDCLSSEQIQILKKDILKGATITSENLINGLLYEK